MDGEDVSFIKKFLLASGSLKEIARPYDVTYPTVRLRLDKLMQKIKISDDAESDPYISLVKRLAVNESLDFDTAKILIGAYKKSAGGKVNDHWDNYRVCIFSVVITDAMSSWEIFGVIAGTFLRFNIPTVILLAIYLAGRGKIRSKKQLDKMHIQDLD